VTREDLADAIRRARDQGHDWTILVVIKGPKWRQRGEHIRTALGLGRVVGSNPRKDREPGCEVLVEYKLAALETFLARWKRMAGEE
jgi:hypothetical protein